MSDSDPLIRLDQAGRAFPGTRSTHGFVLQPTTLEVAAGTWVVITGESGVGKTTLLNLLAGLDRPDEGTVWMFGRDTGKISESALADIRREFLGIVYQQFYFIEHLPVWQNVTCRLIPTATDARTRRARADDVLQELALSDYADRMPTTLSGGEQQRVSLARAIIDSPRVLIADEPTSNVDAKTGEVIVALFKRLQASGATIITSTHERSLIDPADFHFKMHDGKIV